MTENNMDSTMRLNIQNTIESVRHVITTIDPKKDLSWKNMNNVQIKTDGVHKYDNNVRRSYDTAETLSEAVKILKGNYLIRAIEQHQLDHALLFCRTRLDCDNLANYLKLIGGQKYSSSCVHGGLTYKKRKENLKKFTSKKVKFLICTDRELNIAGLPFVVNVTLPDSKSSYIYRISRVERTGLVISLVSTVPEKVWYHGEWCRKKGVNCWNTNLTSVHGCCMWYNENKLYNSYKGDAGYVTNRTLI